MIQIICTILTFSGALALLGLNQWFAARHKLTEVLSGKLEELYTVIDKIGVLCSPGFEPRQSIEDSLSSMRSQAREALKECRRASLLICLYFPTLESRWAETLNAAELCYYEMQSLDFSRRNLLDYVWEKAIKTKGKSEEMLEYITTEAAFLTKRLIN